MIKNQTYILSILLLLALVSCSKEELLTIEDASSVEVMKSGDGSIVDPGGDEDEIIFSPIKSNLNKDKIVDPGGDEDIVDPGGDEDEGLNGTTSGNEEAENGKYNHSSNSTNNGL
jgi:hypothetical protein